MTGGKKYYTIRNYYIVGKKYSVEVDPDTLQPYWETKSEEEDYEDVEDKLWYIQVDEYDGNMVWQNRERHMIDEWYKWEKPLVVTSNMKKHYSGPEWINLTNKKRDEKIKKFWEEYNKKNGE